jgi:hypothetical protein
LAFEEGNTVLVRLGLLPVFLPFDRVVMQEQSAVVLFDLLRSGSVRILELI